MPAIFLEYGRHVGVRPELGLARRLFAPLHALFLNCDRAGDISGCLVIQGLVVECFAEVQATVGQCCARALPIPITMLQALADDMRTVGIEPAELMARFSELFQGSLKLIGFAPSAARRILIRAAASAAAGSARAS